ncbi:MAG: hypothetical protein Q7K03_05995 [Dehalococcoidia bacterium]|nr:hypothetical protein [Dehalococcoidia bacterium]
MGGYFSGRDRWRNTGTVEGCRSLDVRELHRKGWLRPGLVLSLSWTDKGTGREVASIGVRTHPGQIVLAYNHRRTDSEQWQSIEEPVRIAWTACNYGGQRPWFNCPGIVNGVLCASRVAIIYCAGPYYLCRRCYRLAYACQGEGPADRALRGAQKIRMRLGGSPSLADWFPPKPKGMHWSTYERLCSEGELAQRRYLVRLDAWLGKFQR